MATYYALKEYTRRNFFDQDDDKSEAVIGEIVNESVRLIAQAGHWPCLLTEGRINTSASYATGTVTMAPDATTATFSTSAAIPSSVNSAWVMWIGDKTLRVNTRTSAHAITTKTDEILFTSASAASYTLAKSKYLLPSNLRVFVNIHAADQTLGTLESKQPDEFYGYVQNNARWGSFPEIYMLDEQYVHMYPYPNQRWHFRMTYYRWPTSMSSSASVMDFPDAYIDLVHASIRLCVEAHRKNIAPDELIERVTSLSKQVMSRDTKRHGTYCVQPQVLLGWTKPDVESPWPGFRTVD